MPLRDCMNEHTHREYATWMAWFAMDLNRPSRTDHYIMSLISEVRYLLSKKQPTGLEEFKLLFERVDPEKERIRAERRQKVARKLAKDRWMMAVGFRPKDAELNNGNRD